MNYKIKSLLTDLAIAIREYATLLFAIATLAIIFFLLWEFGESKWSDFGLNAFTEVIGIGITVFLIDKLLKKQERRRRLPLEIAAFHDVRRFIDGLAVAWMNVYNWSGKDEIEQPPPVPSVSEFLTSPYFEAICRRLDLNAEACVFPKRTWWEYLPQVEKHHRELGEKILERHVATLDPVAYQLVHKVVHGFLNPDIGLSMLPVTKMIGGFGCKEAWNQLPENQRHPLGRYWVPIEDHLKDFAALHLWYMNNKKGFLGHD